jgi:hypothetical protein
LSLLLALPIFSSTQMKPNVTAIERAFELASTGRFLHVNEIRQQLRYKGYTSETVVGAHLCGQLKSAIHKTLKKQHKPLPEAGESI